MVNTYIEKGYIEYKGSDIYLINFEFFKYQNVPSQSIFFY